MNIGLLISELEDQEVKKICIGASQAAREKKVTLCIMPGKYLVSEKEDENPYDYQHAAVFDYAADFSFDALIVDIDRIGKNAPILKREAFLKKFGSLFVNTAAEAEGVAKKIIEIPVTLEPNGKVPSYAHFGDAGADLYANIKEDISIKPGEMVMIPTGISIAIPKGYELQIRPRSGLSAKTKLRVANTPGTIDSGYRGQICVIMENIAAPIKDITYDFDENGHPVITSILHGEEYTIHNGDRIAQAILSEVPQASYIVVNELPALEEDDRGEGGFGSTGE